MIRVELSEFVEWMKNMGYSNRTISDAVCKIIRLVNDKGAFIDMCREEVRNMYWNCSKYIRHSFVYAWSCFSEYLCKCKLDYIADEFMKWMIRKGYSKETAYSTSNKLKTLVRKFNCFCFSEDDIINSYFDRGRTKGAYLYSFRRFKEFVREIGYVVIIDDRR